MTVPPVRTVLLTLMSICLKRARRRIIQFIDHVRRLDRVRGRHLARSSDITPPLRDVAE
jgi:hypothetical protein